MSYDLLSEVWIHRNGEKRIKLLKVFILTNLLIYLNY